MNDERPHEEGARRRPGNGSRFEASTRRGQIESTTLRCRHDFPLAWTCDVCGSPIADGSGYLELRFAELHEYRLRFSVWEEEHVDDRNGFRMFRGSTYATCPERARWRAHHRGCDPLPESASYAIDVQRIRTAAQLLEWAAHLAEKRWITATNWTAVLRDAARRSDQRLGAAA